MLKYLSQVTTIVLFKPRPECALAYKFDYFVWNFTTTLIPFVLVGVTVMHYIVMRIFRLLLRTCGREQMTPEEAVTCQGKNLLLSSYTRPLTPEMLLRFKWGVVRACITMVVATALPSLLGLLTIFDCTPVDTPSGLVWLLDARRDIECFSGADYWLFVYLHLTVSFIWVVMIIYYMSRSKEAGNTLNDIAISYKVIDRYVCRHV